MARSLPWQGGLVATTAELLLQGSFLDGLCPSPQSVTSALTLSQPLCLSPAKPKGHLCHPGSVSPWRRAGKGQRRGWLWLLDVGSSRDKEESREWMESSEQPLLPMQSWNGLDGESSAVLISSKPLPSAGTSFTRSGLHGQSEEMSNSSSISHFLLLALADTRQLQLLHFCLFLGISLAALLGNGLIISAVACSHLLHTPMFFFLLNLALTDLGSICTTVPKAMHNSLWDTRIISYTGCAVQVFLFFFSYVSRVFPPDHHEL
ncbi:hypothetical protein DUI87_12118 [Hirundo rustica rustica]|uniref:G-protein coupled receptors family 1 profile domain-containing protein n=1 Tax=Hirundo rustica rustica TaxID=333673 RepID=A0A3M0KDA8_HIRRU|nr:hypothetical protein DUI87_12118 [Hirundo rustica rustica]